MYTTILNIPEKLCANRACLDNAARKSLVVHQRRRVGQAVFLDEFTGDPSRHAGTVRWDEEPNTGVSTATHGSTTCIHHETYQETANIKQTTQQYQHVSK